MELDLHIHTIASGHAYSTVDEVARAAADKKLKMISISDHAPAMPGSAQIFHFHNLRVLPEYLYGVRLLKGVECNIIDYQGKLDIEDSVLEHDLELVMASFHPVCIEPAGIKEHTYALRRIIDNPYVHIIGHPGDSRYAFDIPEIVKAASEAGVLLEINNSSLLPISFRPGGHEEILKIARECADVNAPVILGSDAHFTDSVGRLSEAYELCVEAGLPDELIVNREANAFMKKYLDKK